MVKYHDMRVTIKTLKIQTVIVQAMRIVKWLAERNEDSIV